MQRIKLICSLFAVLLFAQSLEAQSRTKENYNMLWEISGKGLKKPSYLMGSMHLTDKRLFEFPDSLAIIMGQADALAMEIDPDSLALYIFRDRYDGSAEEYMLYSHKYGVGSGIWSEIFPSNVEGLYSSWVIEEFRRSEGDSFPPCVLDLYLYTWAKRHQKSTGGLETVRGHINELNVFTQDSLVTEEAVELLEKDSLFSPDYMYNDDNGGFGFGDMDSIQEAFKDIYASGSLDSLQNFLMKNGSTRSMYTSGFIRRNYNMIAYIDSVAQEKSLVAVMGCGHLVGPSNLIELLRGRGYTLRPVTARFPQDTSYGLPDFDRVLPNIDYNFDKFGVTISTNVGLIATNHNQKTYFGMDMCEGVAVQLSISDINFPVQRSFGRDSLLLSTLDKGLKRKRNLMNDLFEDKPKKKSQSKTKEAELDMVLTDSISTMEKRFNEGYWHAVKYFVRDNDIVTLHLLADDSTKFLLPGLQAAWNSIRVQPNTRAQGNNATAFAPKVFDLSEIGLTALLPLDKVEIQGDSLGQNMYSYEELNIEGLTGYEQDIIRYEFNSIPQTNKWFKLHAYSFPNTEFDYEENDNNLFSKKGSSKWRKERLKAWKEIFGAAEETAFELDDELISLKAVLDINGKDKLHVWSCVRDRWVYQAILLEGPNFFSAAEAKAFMDSLELVPFAAPKLQLDSVKNQALRIAAFNITSESELDYMPEDIVSQVDMPANYRSVHRPTSSEITVSTYKLNPYNWYQNHDDFWAQWDETQISLNYESVEYTDTLDIKGLKAYTYELSRYEGQPIKMLALLRGDAITQVEFLSESSVSDSLWAEIIRSIDTLPYKALSDPFAKKNEKILADLRKDYDQNLYLALNWINLDSTDLPALIKISDSLLLAERNYQNTDLLHKLAILYSELESPYALDATFRILDSLKLESFASTIMNALLLDDSPISLERVMEIYTSPIEASTVNNSVLDMYSWVGVDETLLLNELFREKYLPLMLQDTNRQIHLGHLLENWALNIEGYEEYALTDKEFNKLVGLLKYFSEVEKLPAVLKAGVSSTYDYDVYDAYDEDVESEEPGNEDEYAILQYKRALIKLLCVGRPNDISGNQTIRAIWNSPSFDSYRASIVSDLMNGAEDVPNFMWEAFRGDIDAQKDLVSLQRYNEVLYLIPWDIFDRDSIMLGFLEEAAYNVELYDYEVIESMKYYVPKTKNEEFYYVYRVKSDGFIKSKKQHLFISRKQYKDPSTITIPYDLFYKDNIYSDDRLSKKVRELIDEVETYFKNIDETVEEYDEVYDEEGDIPPPPPPPPAPGSDD
jgi:uncharacterized protein YbaP (TraB family)